MGYALKLRIASTPPRSTPKKMREKSLAHSRQLLITGIPAGLSGVKKQAVEAEYEVAVFREKHNLL